ncbi:MAG TPA: 5-oxoprolinase subunit PxpB [Opitutaceae bacterium]|jgi:inhibitor of KinA
MKLEPLGDSAVVATLGTGIDPSTLSAVQGLAAAVRAAAHPAITDVVPAYATVTVFYDPVRFPGPESPYASACAVIGACARLKTGASSEKPKLVEIPVCYGGEFGPDVASVAAHNGLSTQDVVLLHAKADYFVQAIGFTPGFPYLAGLPKSLRTPRRATPRAHVPAGSVAIGGAQTGVYPIDSPGGWHLIGRTPLALFSAARIPPALLRPGDLVRFRPISAAELETWK